MPIDPSILLKFQNAPQIESPVNALTKGMQLQALQDESDFNSLRRAELEDSINQQKGLNALFADPSFQYGTKESLRQIGRVAPGALPKYAKLFAESEKESRLAEAARLEGVAKTLSVGRDLLAGAQGQDQWTSGIEWIAKNAPGMEQQIPPMWTPVNQQNIVMTADRLATQINERLKGFTLAPGEVRFGMQRGVPEKIASAPPILEPRQQGPQMGTTEGTPGQPRQAYRLSSNPDGTLKVETAPIPDTAKPTLAETLDVKDIADRNKKYVGAKAAVESFEIKAAQHIKDLRDLAKHSGLNSITGVLYGRTPSFTGTGRAAEVLFKKVDSNDLLETITEIKRQSPTGASPLGQFTDSDRETVRSTSGFSRTLDAADLKQELLKAADRLEGVRNRARKTFNETYEYKNSAPTTSATTPANTPAAAPDKLGSVSNPNVIKGQADFNALPSGAYFRGPDNIVRRKP